MATIRFLADLSPTQQRDVLALLFANHREDERSGRVEKACQFIGSGELDPTAIATSWDGDCLTGVLVGEVLPGNSASVWPIRSLPHRERLVAEDLLYQQLMRSLFARGVKFAQTILPTANDAASIALSRNGFRRITQLLHMRCAVALVRPAFRPSLQMETQFDGATAEFTQVLTDSCNEGLDIPELSGLRTTDEIMAGHRSDTPDLFRWWLARWNREPAAVLMLGDGPDAQVAELAYCGVAPSFRRRGVGRAVLAFALQKARDFEAEALSLQVDERNQPAIALYRQFGFTVVDSREVYLRVGS
jgi:GNAT superfamily N-acetyltransferase